MATSAEIEAAVEADEQRLAVSDLDILQAFVTQANSATFTVQGFIDAFGALAAQLGDPGRQRIVNNLHDQMNNNFTQFAELVQSTARAATPA